MGNNRVERRRKLTVYQAVTLVPMLARGFDDAMCLRGFAPEYDSWNEPAQVQYELGRRVGVLWHRSCDRLVSAARFHLYERRASKAQTRFEMDSSDETKH